MTINAIANFFNFGKTSAPSLSESEIKASLNSNLSGNNPLILNFGKNVAQDVLLLKALNEMEKSDDEITWARTTLLLADLGQRIVRCEKGPLLAIQEYNKSKLADVTQDGNIDQDKLLSMNGLELHFFLNMAANPALHLNDRADLIFTLREIADQEEDSQSKDLLLKSLEASSSHVLNFLNECANQYLRPSGGPVNRSEPYKEQSSLNDQMSRVSPGTIVQIEKDGTVTPSQVKTRDAPQFHKEEKKSSGFLDKLRNLFSRNAQGNDTGNTTQAPPRNNLATRIANWWHAFTTSGTNPR